jgi:tetratricopeptide (TPR) repeat protein
MRASSLAAATPLSLLTMTTLCIVGLLLPARADALRKDGFSNAVFTLVAALDITGGGTRQQIDTALDRMERELAAWDEALDAFERRIRDSAASSSAPDAAQQLTSLAAALLERGRFERTLETLDAAMRLDDTRHVPWLLRGVTLDAMGNTAAARAAYEAAYRAAHHDPIAAYHLIQTADPERGDAQLQSATEALIAAHTRLLSEGAQGRRAPFIHTPLLDDQHTSAPIFLTADYRTFVDHVLHRRYDEALSTVRDVVRRDPLYNDLEGQPSEVHRRRSLHLQAQADFHGARQEMEAAVYADPSNERAQLGLALLLGEMVRPPAEVVRVLERAHSSLPESGAINWMLAQLYQALGREQEFGEVLERVMELPPLTRGGIVALAVGQTRNRNWRPNSQVAFMRNVTLNPNSAAAHLALGVFHHLWGENTLALAELTAAVLIDPEAVEAHRQLGQLHFESERYAAAVQALRFVTERLPNDERARYGLANALLRSGRNAEGELELKVYKKLAATALEARRVKLRLTTLAREARLREEAGDFPEAVALMERYVHLQPDVAHNHLLLSDTLIAAGELHRAAEQLERARALGAPPSVHLRLADLYQKLGRPDASREALAQYKHARGGTSDVCARGKC